METLGHLGTTGIIISAIILAVLLISSYWGFFILYLGIKTNWRKKNYKANKISA